MQVWIGGVAATVAYAGRSQFQGLDLINTAIPAGVTPGCYVSVVVQIGNNISNFTTLPVAANGGPCSNAITGLSGDVLGALTSKTLFTLGAAGLNHNTSPSLLPGGQDTTDDLAKVAFYRFHPAELANAQQYLPQVSYGSCTLWSFAINPDGSYAAGLPAALDAGDITITSNGVGRLMRRGDNGIYNLDSGTGTFYNGIVTVSSPGGADIGRFTAGAAMPSGFVWLNRNDATSVSRANGQAIAWTGAAAGTYVQIAGSSIAWDATPRPSAATSFVCVAPAAANQFTIPSWVLLALPPSTFVNGVPLGGGTLTVSNSATPVPFAATGLDQGMLTFSVSSSRGVTYR